MEKYLNGFTEKASQSDGNTCYVLDTNYLVDSLSSVNNSEKYFKAIMENDSSVFIPFIVWVEFNYSVQKTLKKTEELLKESSKFLEKYNTKKLEVTTGDIKTKFNNLFNQNIINGNPVGVAISEDIKEYFDKKIDEDLEIKDIINSLTKRNEEILKDWEEEFQAKLNKKIEDHIDKTEDLLINFKNKVSASEQSILVGKEYSIEDLEYKIRECQLREENLLYPGNSPEDLDKKGCRIWGNLKIPRKYGDMLLWLELIEFAQKHKELTKFVLVSNDTEKEDWVIKKSKKLFPQLLIEFYTKTSGSTIEHMKSLDFVTKFSPEVSHEDLQRDYMVQPEQMVLDFDDIEVNDEPIDDLFDGIELFDYPYMDTIIVPARLNGFKEVFLGEDRWYSINISNDRIPYLKYIAVYQSQPVSAVTYIARIKRIEKSPFKPGRKMVIFDGPAKQLKRSIPIGNDYTALQGPRYTNHTKLNSARTTDDLWDFDDLFDDDL